MNNQYPNSPYNSPAQNRAPVPPEVLARYQSVRVPPRRRKPLNGCCSCGLALLVSLALLGVLVVVYLLAPLRTNLLVLGIDRVPDGTALGRSDTMILVSVNPLLPTVKMLSIPRDLWVPIQGVGENRINTAHFYAEANQPGSGPAAAVQTVQQNFAVPVTYYVRVRFDAFQRIVDALGGVTVTLANDTALLPAGQHTLNGEQALAFVRDRKGSDDFFRMEHGQVMLKAVIKQLLSPRTWSRLPLVYQAVASSVDTNLPAWQIPRLGFALMRAGISDTIDNRTIRREMTTPTITSGGANVLMPNWDLIRPYVKEMFAP